MIRRIAHTSLLAASVAACAPGPVEMHDQRERMGTQFSVTIVTEDAARGERAIAAAFDEIERVEALLSEWRETSEISELNRRAGEGPVEVGSDLVAVLLRSAWVSEVTRGAFDVTFATCGRHWSFRQPRIPAREELVDCLEGIGYERVHVDEEASTVRIDGATTRLGIAAIGKGYGIDAAARELESRGIVSYVVDGGGDVRVRGTHDGGPWRVGIAHPRERGLYGEVELEGGAIVTSGDYAQFFERDGMRYHHVIDPRTGRPARGAIAATVIGPTATDADGLATGLLVLGVDEGLEVVESLPGFEALIFAPDGEPHASSGFPSI